MASEEANVDTTKMIQAAQSFLERHEQLKGQVTNLQNGMDALGRSWGGETAATFIRGGMTEFYRHCDGVLDALYRLSQDVDTAALNYDKTHNLNTDLATDLQRKLAQASQGLPGFGDFSGN